MMMRKGILAVWFACLVLPTGVMAQPTETGETGLISTPTTKTLDPGKIHLGYF